MFAETYGLHLVLRLDGIEDRSALDDPAAVDEFLRALVQRVEMRILAGPLVGREEGGPDRSGVSGVVILYESHAAIHTYPALGGAFVDVFSCRHYDHDVVLAVLGEFFGSHRVREMETFTRGRHWGADVEAERLAWTRSREAGSLPAGVT